MAASINLLAKSNSVCDEEMVWEVVVGDVEMVWEVIVGDVELVWLVTVVELVVVVVLVSWLWETFTINKRNKIIDTLLFQFTLNIVT